ncbi:lipoprotein [Roseovarius sp. 22II1-1F6A]|nr:lipoprotein [Roseovarius sp. 22II1-1F6A]
MTIIRTIAILALGLTVAACDAPKQNKTVDNGIDTKDLSRLKAGIWVDPNGCEHWIIDDGAEGYLSQRLQPNGKPVCGYAPGSGGVAIGAYKKGSAISDPI